jgi:hypothetical protein
MGRRFRVKTNVALLVNDLLFLNFYLTLNLMISYLQATLITTFKQTANCYRMFECFEANLEQELFC